MDAAAGPSITSLLHSVDATYTVYVQFQNGTQRFVDIIWIDYLGQWIRYETLSPGDSYDVYTYVSHPWVFLDGDTGIRLQAVGRGRVFFPLMSDCRQELDSDGAVHLAPVQITVSVPVFSLRQRCLEVMCLLATDRDAFLQLSLPREIINELLTTYDAPATYQVLDSALIDTEEEQQEADDEGFNETAEEMPSDDFTAAHGSEMFDTPPMYETVESEIFSESMVSEAVANVLEQLQLTTTALAHTALTLLPASLTSATSSLTSTVGSSQSVPPRPLPRFKFGVEQTSTTDDEVVPPDADDEDDSSEENIRR